MFFLSAKEAGDNLSSLIAKYDDGTAGQWWLRSPDKATTNKVARVNSEGSIQVTFPQVTTIAARPAFWLDLTSDFCAVKSGTGIATKWTINVNNTSHNLGTPTYTWADDNSTCTATATCSTCSQEITETVDTSYEEITPATTEAAGTGRYKATFEKDAFSAQTKDVEIPKINNDWTAADFVIEDGAITGLSEAGTAKLETNPDVVLPSADGEGNAVTTVSGIRLFAAKAITSLTVPDTYTSLGTAMCNGCTSLSQVTLSKNLQAIPTGCFGGCTSLKTIDIPNSVTEIGNQAFQRGGIESVEIPGSVKSIGNSAFAAASAAKATLSSLTLNEGLESVGGLAFSNNKISSTVNLPSTVKILPDNAFGSSGTKVVLIPAEDTQYPETVVKNGKAHIFQTKSVEITLDAKGGTLETTSVMTNADGKVDVESLPTPQKDGNKFGGWFLDEELKNEVTADTIFFDPATIYASWNESFQITFDPNGGTVEPTSADTVEGKLESLPTPVKEGSVFKGWFTTKGGSELVTKDYSFVKNTTIYAQWIAAGDWIADDFTYNEAGNAITGLSDNGLDKLATKKDMTIPYLNGSTVITEIAGISIETSESDDSVQFDCDVDHGPFVTDTEKLNSVTLGSNIEKIGDGAFMNSGLTRFSVIGSNLKEIGVAAFQRNSLSSVTVPTNLERLGAGAFATNPNLTSVSILSTKITEIPTAAFGCSDAKNYMEGWTAVSIPATITKIGAWAFAGNNFKSITIPANVTEIGRFAFSTKNYLEDPCTLDFKGNAITTIGSRAFRNKVIDRVGIPASVNSLASNAFEKAYSDPDKAIPVTKMFFDNSDQLDAYTASVGETNLAKVEKYQKAFVEFTVTFNENGGATKPDAQKTYGSKLTSIPETSKEGMGFVGWFTSAEGGNLVTTDYGFNADTTVYARWADPNDDWDADDFTYGDFELSTDRVNTNDAVYPGDDSQTYMLPGTKNVVTGFSASGAAKLSAGKTDLVIPAKDNKGLTVQGIGEKAFNDKGLTSVAMPEGVTTKEHVEDVNEKWGPKGYLTEGSVDSLGDFYICSQAFANNSLTDVIIPEGTILICRMAFNNNKIQSVKLPSTLAVIVDSAFAGNKNGTANVIETVEFPEKTDIRLSVRNLAFAFNKLSAVTLPADTLNINAVAFSGNKGSGRAITTGTPADKLGEIVTATMAATRPVSNQLNRIGSGSNSLELALSDTAVETAKTDYETAKATADTSKGAAEAAAKTPGQAAVDAAKKAQADAEAAKAAAEAYKQAADGYAEAAEQLYGPEDEKTIAAKQTASAAANAVTETEKAVEDAAKAVSAAQTAKEKADKEAADKAGMAKVTTITINVKSVSAAAIDKAIKTAGGNKQYVTKIVLGSKVKKIRRGAFKTCKKVTTLEVRSKKLKKKAIKGSLKGSAVKTIRVKVAKKAKTNKKYVKKYKKIFTKKNVGKKVKVKR